MKKNTLKIVLVITAAWLLGCGSDRKGPITDDQVAVAVETRIVGASDDRTMVTASGKVDAVHSAELSTRMMGFVDRVNVAVGDKVEKGEVLMVINNTDLQARLARASAGVTEAKAAFRNAESDYNRFKNLLAENSASRKEMDDMTTSFEMAKARLEVARQVKNEVNAQFSYTNIRAPFSGVVTRRFIEPGDMANPGITLVEVEGQGRFEVSARVAERDISHIHSGCVVDVAIKSINRNVQGKVTEVSTSASGTGGQYLIKVALTETDDKIRSGMFATVDFPVQADATSTVPRIPKEALISRAQLKGVYTVSQSGTAMLRWLRLGRVYGDSVEVLSGLASGEQYILSAKGKLYNGAKITIQ